MKFRTIKVLFVLTFFIFTAACSGRQQIDTNMLKYGDIIFQNKKSDNGELLNLLTAPQFNHMGILISKNGKWYVLEASHPVELTPVAGWINSGDSDAYVVKRLKEAEAMLIPENIDKLKKVKNEYLGKPYDVYFAWSDDAFYSSELVWKIFKKALNIELCAPQILGDFDLTSAGIREKVKEVYGNKVPLYEEVISPESLFNSDHLITIMDNR